VKKSRTVYKFLVIFWASIAIFVIASCHNTSLQSKQSQADSVAARSPIETQVVNHLLGQVQIPVEPQRVVVLHDMLLLNSVLALGVKPVGITYWPHRGERFRGIPSDLVDNILQVGSVSQPSLEKILALKPDLILGIAFQKNYYKTLSAIAPTVLIDNYELYDFKERLRYIAQTLGRQNRAEEVLTKYQEQIQQLQQQLGGKLEELTVSILALEGQGFRTYRQDYVISSQVVRDINLHRPPIQQNQQELAPLWSIEVLPEHDADVLFVMADWTKENPEPLSFLEQPIWSQLKAVQNNRVYEVDWHVGGPLGANRIIDDLFKYLVNTP